jgi:hypothetical protein
MGKFFKRIDFKYLFWVFFYLFIFCLLLRNSFNYLDPDLGWHLKVGQNIIQTGLVPSVNQYNYTFTGNWVDHEWLSNVGLYFIYSHFGYLAVNIFFALLIVLVLIILNLAIHRRYPQLGVFSIALLQIFGLIACLPHFGVRIQEVGLLFLLLLLLFIDYYNRRESWLILLVLPPFMYLWACLHASFLIGFFLLGSWIIIKIGERILIHIYPRPWLNMSETVGNKKIIIFSGAVFLSLAVTCLTPYYLKLYSFLAGYQDTFYQTHIQEWLPQWSFPFQYWQLLYLAVIFLALLGYIYHSLSREKYFKINLWSLFLVIVFIALSFKSRRHFPLMFVVTFIFLVEIYSTVFRQMVLEKTWNFKSWRPWLRFCLILCLALVIMSELIQIKFTDDPFTSFCSDYPCGAVKFLQNHPEYNSDHLFNDYAWGGFLIWADPSRRLFIDGRLPQVPFGGHSFLEEYLDFFKKDTDFSKKLAQYQIQLILMPIKDKKNTAQNWEKILFDIKDSDLLAPNYFRNFLLTTPDWHPVYSDKTAVIYAKK